MSEKPICMVIDKYCTFLCRYCLQLLCKHFRFYIGDSASNQHSSNKSFSDIVSEGRRTYIIDFVNLLNCIANWQIYSRNESCFFRCKELKFGTDVTQGVLNYYPDEQRWASGTSLPNTRWRPAYILATPSMLFVIFDHNSIKIPSFGTILASMRSKLVTLDKMAEKMAVKITHFWLN